MRPSQTEVEFEFVNVVRRVREDPRVTLPYTPEQWAAIDALGRDVDARLDDGDVRLTMGGEPTFVSIDDMEGDEWNIAADSAAKRRLAHDLTERLRERFAAGGLVQYGQGKWYPGEPLPRWQIGIVWRRDGEPLWTRAGAARRPVDARDAAARPMPKRLLTAIADRFGIDARRVAPGLRGPDRDGVERGAPARPGIRRRVDATDDDADAIDEPDARHRLIERLSGPLAPPAGFVLPLRPADDGDGWLSTEWTLRRGRFYLVGG